ncbi:hypothetical protein F5Y08DRAFT_307981 [Xylaria arbuscula]|nr:hypothetical protein F5Y08DRAFT_307981 [Xylaria arbuscula]
MKPIFGLLLLLMLPILVLVLLCRRQTQAMRHRVLHVRPPTTLYTPVPAWCHHDLTTPQVPIPCMEFYCGIELQSPLLCNVTPCHPSIQPLSLSRYTVGDAGHRTIQLPVETMRQSYTDE